MRFQSTTTPLERRNVGRSPAPFHAPWGAPRKALCARRGLSSFVTSLAILGGQKRKKQKRKKEKGEKGGGGTEGIAGIQMRSRGFREEIRVGAM